MKRTAALLTSIPVTGLVAALVTALAVPIVPLGAGPAAAASKRGQVTMPCNVIYDGRPNDGIVYDVGVSYQLEVPASVKPGQTVSLKGVVALQFPEELRKTAADYVDYFDGYSDTVSVALSMGGTRRVHVADRWQTGRAPLGNPMVIKAPVTFPAFTVPAGASGQVTIALPHNDVVKNPYGQGPGTVALTGHANARGAAWNFNYSLACWRSDKGSGTIATIPITSAGAATGPAQGAGGAAATPGAEAAGAAAPGAAAPGTSAPGADVHAADPFAATAATAGDAAAATSGESTTALGLGSAEARDGVFVPAWLLVTLGLGACVLAALYSAWLHLRLRALRKAAD